MKNTLQQLLRSFLSFRYGDVIHPMRDWLIVLTTGAVILIGSIAWNVWLFNKAVRGELIGDVSAPQTKNAFENLPAVRDILEERRAEENRYKTEAVFVDPSHFAE